MHGHCKAGYGPARQHQHEAPFYGKFSHGWAGGPIRRPKHNVPVNILEQENAFEVHVYALGFDKENIQVSVADDLLYIRGSRNPDKEPIFLRQEYPIKSFERVIQLNDKVDIESISARQENGVLVVTLPKKPETPKSAQNVAIA